jgi:hypothetical protein
VVGFLTDITFFSDFTPNPIEDISLIAGFPMLSLFLETAAEFGTDRIYLLIFNFINF